MVAFLFHTADKDKVRGEKELAQIFSWIIFLLKKKQTSVVKFCLLGCNMLDSFCKILKKKIKFCTASNFSYLTQWSKCRILSYCPWSWVTFNSLLTLYVASLSSNIYLLIIGVNSQSQTLFKKNYFLKTWGKGSIKFFSKFGQTRPPIP